MDTRDNPFIPGVEECYASYRQLVKDKEVFDVDNNSNIEIARKLSTLLKDAKTAIEGIRTFANHPFLVKQLPSFMNEIHEYLDHLFDASNTLDANLESKVKVLKQLGLLLGIKFEHVHGYISPAKTRRVLEDIEEEEEEVPLPLTLPTPVTPPPKPVTPPPKPVTPPPKPVTPPPKPVTPPPKHTTPPNTIQTEEIPAKVEEERETNATQQATQEAEEEENEVVESKPQEDPPVVIPPKLIVHVDHVAPPVTETKKKIPDHVSVNFHLDDEDDDFVNHTGDPLLNFMHKNPATGYGANVHSNNNNLTTPSRHSPTQMYSESHHRLHPSSTFTSLIDDSTDKLDACSLTTYDYMESIERTAVENHRDPEYDDLPDEAIMENNEHLTAPGEVNVPSLQTIIQLQEKHNKKIASKTRKPNPNRVDDPGKRIKLFEEQPPPPPSSSSSSSLKQNPTVAKKTLPSSSSAAAAVVPVVDTGIHSAYIFYMDNSTGEGDKNTWTDKNKKTLDDCIISYTSSDQYKLDVGAKDKDIKLANQKFNFYGHWKKGTNKKKRGRPGPGKITPSLFHGKTAPAILSLFMNEYVDA